jgi:L-lactate dehydrogenase complex protein LldG
MKDDRHSQVLQAGSLRKDRVMKDIREALIDRNDIANGDNATDTAEVVSEEDLSVAFAQHFTQAGGTMYYCLNENDIRQRMEEIQHRHGDIVIGCASENLASFLGHIGMENCCLCEPTKRYPFGATLCEALIAWQGGIVITSNLGLGKTIPSLPETTVVLAFTSQVVADWQTANDRLKTLYTDYPEQIIITQPSSYAYRKGQQKLYLILIEDETN